MRLVLALDPSSIEFGEANSGGPYPYLNDVGDLLLSARAGEAIGLASKESSTVTVRLNNRGRRAATIIGRPLRVAADIYDDDGVLFASGTVSDVTYGDEIVLEVAA